MDGDGAGAQSARAIDAIRIYEPMRCQAGS
jgi:hypothetical protein